MPLHYAHDWYQHFHRHPNQNSLLILLMKLYLFSALILFNSTITNAENKATEARLDEVERLGRHVMPFNLEQTLHVFSKIKTGGLQQVIVKDPLAKDQINLIREHLTQIAKDFKQSNFSDPEKIHGKDMPGLKALQAAKKGDISIQYQEIPEGAEILYTSDNLDLVNAIHQWFDAQLSDHARHATMHHQMHHQDSKK